jgi:transcriptional regulator with XRE-family HTH domain
VPVALGAQSEALKNDSEELAGLASPAPDIRRRELANFLRARREAISPEDVGLPRLRRRRTPGLRREEVAFLAGIGAAWYARLEMGHEISPSSETLLSITQALRLNVVETEYVFELAGFGIPQFHESIDAIVPQALEQFIPTIETHGAIFFDRYLTMLRWNSIADAMFGIAEKSKPGERNTLYRLINDPRLLTTFGDDFERLAGGVIAVFRRAYAAGEPTPFAKSLHTAILANPRLAELWENYVVADNVFEGEMGPFERHHPVLGSFTIVTSNLIVSRQQGTILRIIAPADAPSAETFKRLASLGSPSTVENNLP